MNRKIAILLSLVTLLSVCGIGVMYHRVRSFDRKNNCDVLAGIAPQSRRCEEQSEIPSQPTKLPTPEVISAGEVRTNRVESVSKAETVRELKIDRIDYEGQMTLCVVLNGRPDMDVAKRYISVEPLREGSLGFRYRSEWNWRRRTYEPTIVITGDFAFRTNSTLRIRKGFPLYSDRKMTMAEGSLKEDFVHTFARKDPMPKVEFVDGGRYLPPVGKKSIKVESVSVTNIYMEIRRVEPRNVVHMLAREEGVYHRWSYSKSADNDVTLDFAGEMETNTIRCANRPCETEVNSLPVGMHDGESERGIFLVNVRNGDKPECYYRWSGNDDRYNPSLYRLVCLSDLGLSVRRYDDTMGVWVTSLTTGCPVESVEVEVYSSANILIGTGRTGDNGWCEIQRCKAGEPFAVIARTRAKDDMTFIALGDSIKVGESYEEGKRDCYPAADDTDAFVWTERGIYRHGERIFTHIILRNGTNEAPKPMPVVLTLYNPNGEPYAEKTIVTDNDGIAAYVGFSVPADQPSGVWRIRVSLPGKVRTSLDEREVKVEEFAPPQIRVNVDVKDFGHPTNFAFTVSAEQLFGGPARQLGCEGAVVFEDVPFAPAEWKGYCFGNDDLGLKPCFRRLSQRVLDDNGNCEYIAPIFADSGRPKAAVRATGQGVVFEDGGRSAAARKSVVCHYYPYYIGSRLKNWLRMPVSGSPKINVVCVGSDGKEFRGRRKLSVKIEQIDSVYSYKTNDEGWSTWDCERVRSTVIDGVTFETGEDGTAVYEMPLNESGDYFITIEDKENGVSFGRAFYLSDWGDNAVRAPLSNPTKVVIQPDKAFYRVGETPHLIVKSPFTGYAMMSVLHNGSIYSEMLNLTNATSEVRLRPIEHGWAPNVDVTISVIQSVGANAQHLAVRAHGQTTVSVRPVENEIDVKLNAAVDIKSHKVAVSVDAPGATAATITLVDEGINILTGERQPDPIGRFSRLRAGDHPLFDVYSRVLPVVEDGLKANGVKTGGGFGAEMLSRVSPVPTRRFKPLSMWKAHIEINDGHAMTEFKLPEFVGEVRVTAVAYSRIATGSAAIHCKVTPKLVMRPDAPRFTAPGDEFEAVLPLSNRSGGDGEAEYSIDGSQRSVGKVFLADGASTNVVVRMKAPVEPGEMRIAFAASGFGERHESEIMLPVRPAVAWRETAGMERVNPGDVFGLTAKSDCARFELALNGSPVAEVVSALEWLSSYPHGCLEQTVSKIFPLITAGGILNSVASAASSNRIDYVKAGVHRVVSMIRWNDFSMWPDCNYTPWDPEVSLYASHFMFEVKKSVKEIDIPATEKILNFNKKWAMSTNTCISAYACHNLALVGEPEKDRMLRLFDIRENLSSVSRARLARAFVEINDIKRAEALMNYSFEPQSIREAAFMVLALIDINPDDARIPPLVKYLADSRDNSKHCWGTTGDNAHALLAIGAYYQHHPFKAGDPVLGFPTKADGAEKQFPPMTNREIRVIKDAGSVTVSNGCDVAAFLAWKELSLPDVASTTNESNGISIERRFFCPDGTAANLNDLSRGEMLIVELTLKTDVDRMMSDLVVEDLFAGAFEPVHSELDPSVLKAIGGMDGDRNPDWVMRKDARDDRMLVFSKRFKLEKDNEAKVFYPVRVVSAGDFVLPGTSVEGMYNPSLRARLAPCRIVVRH